MEHNAVFLAFAKKVADIVWWSTNAFPQGAPDLPADKRIDLLVLAREAIREAEAKRA